MSVESSATSADKQTHPSLTRRYNPERVAVQTEGAQNDQKSQRRRRTRGKHCLLDCGTHELRAAVAACIRSAQDQARHHFSVEEKGFMSPQPATLELCTINGFWGLKFSLRMQFLVGKTYSCGWPHTQEYKDSSNWSLQAIEKRKKRDTKLRGVCSEVRVELREVKGRC